MSTLYTNGATVSFTPSGGSQAGVSEITRITVNLTNNDNQRQKISTAHLGTPITQAAGTATLRFEEPYVNIWQPTKVGSGSSLEVEYLGGGSFSGGVSGALSVQGPFSISVTNATVSSSVVTGAVGDLVRGSVTFSW